MVKASRGTRSKTRQIFRKSPRMRGMTSITHEFQTFEKGEKVSVVIDPSVHYGTPHSCSGQDRSGHWPAGSRLVVELYDGNKLKTVIARPEHLKKAL